MTKKSSVRFGNSIKKYLGADFAYSTPGFRYVGENGPTQKSNVEILDMSVYQHRTIFIHNKHPDISINVNIDIAHHYKGLLNDYELGTIVDDTIGPGQNKLYYPGSHPELDIPSPGLVVGLQRQEEPLETGHGIDVFILGGL